MTAHIEPVTGYNDMMIGYNKNLSLTLLDYHRYADELLVETINNQSITGSTGTLLLPGDKGTVQGLALLHH